MAQKEKPDYGDSEHPQIWNFSIFSGMGSGCLEIGGGRGGSRSGEVNPSAALSGTDFDGMRGGLLCFYALTSSANADIYPHIYLLSRS